ncbi:MAG: family 10 glycosylhydrolase [Oscillospiraceae bacterium]|nr:family 10 glycosylhydrolase [Oscillospiraceae bacterium]
MELLKISGKITACFVLITSLLFSACAEQKEAEPYLLNAGGLEGAELPVHNNVLPPAPPPESAEKRESRIINSTPPQSEKPETDITTSTPASSAPASAANTPKSAESANPPVSATTTPTPETPKPTTTTTPPPVVTGDYKPLNYGEVRGVWISYIELQGAFAGGTEESFRTAFGKMMDNCKTLGINTVYVHLRAFGDAFYDSQWFPWSKYITGTVGENPGFDPLTIMLEEAHKRNISFHGWLNPIRLMTDADMAKISTDYPVGQMYNDSRKGSYIVKSGDYWYFNPAYIDVLSLFAGEAADIIRKYDIDGLHIDDYFYPPNCPASFDSAAFAASNHTDLSKFRLENCNTMVSYLYNIIKTANPSVLFGISPQGSVENCYKIYADVKLWASEAGYCDYIVPQIYYGFDNAAQPFDKCLAEWEEFVKGGRVKLITGLAVYKIGLEDTWAGEKGKNEWILSDDILKQQIDLSKTAGNYGGVVFFSYRYLFGEANTPAINTQLSKAGLR